MPKIMYASGREVYISPKELDHTIVRMMNAGVRMMKIKSGNNLFLNSNTMDYIDNTDMPAKLEDQPEVSVVALDTVGEEKVVDMIIIPNEEVKPESAVQKEIKVLEEIMAKGSCMHEPEKLKLYHITGVKGKRYFNVCSFCGWRSKFIKADSFSETQLSGAEQYVEK